MATIRVVFENGEPQRAIQFDPAGSPFQQDGKPRSILDVLCGRQTVDAQRRSCAA